MLIALLLLCSSVTDSNITAAEPSPVRFEEGRDVVPWSPGAVTLGGDGRPYRRVGFTESVGGGVLLTGTAPGIFEHAFALQVSALRELDLRFGLRLEHSIAMFVPNVETTVGLQAQLLNRSRVALGLMIQSGVHISTFNFALALTPEATLTMSALVSSRGTSAFTLEASLGLRSFFLLGLANSLLPTTSFGFTYHIDSRTFFLRASYAPLLTVGDGVGKTSAGPLGTAWLAFGGSWTSKI